MDALRVVGIGDIVGKAFPPEALLRYLDDGCIEIGRVENRRSGISLPVGLGGAFASPPHSGLA